MVFVENREWSKQKLIKKVSEEMVDFIVENIKIPNLGKGNDIPWWTGNTQGKFSVKSAWEIIRNKRERKKEYKQI